MADNQRQDADYVAVPLSDVDPLSPTYKGGLMTGATAYVLVWDTGGDYYVGAYPEDGYRRLDPGALAPPLEGGDWGFAEDLDDGGMAEASGESDGAE